MTEMKHGVDESFSDRLNILRAAVIGATDGISVVEPTQPLRHARQSKDN